MLKHTVYSILIVSDSDKFLVSLTEVLPKATFEPIEFAQTVNEAMRFINERRFDFIIINAPLKDDTGLNLATHLTKSKESTVLFVVNELILADIKFKLIELGVFTLSKPFSAKILMQTIDNLCSHRHSLETMQQRVVSVESKMMEIRHVNQAKLLLMEHQNLTEEKAHHWIEKQAMNSHVTKDVIALQIISQYAST